MYTRMVWEGVCFSSPGSCTSITRLQMLFFGLKWGDYGLPSNNKKCVLGLARFCCFLDLLLFFLLTFNHGLNHHFQLEKGGTSPRLFWGSFKDTSKLRLQ